MSKHSAWRRYTGLVLSGLILLSQTPMAQGQYTGNKQDVIRPDLSKSAPDIRAEYPLFKSKCGECHDLDRSLKASLPNAQWSTVIKQMQAMPSAHFSDSQAQRITAFLITVAGERTESPQAAAAAGVSNAAETGKQFYAAQNCAMCHSIAGEGGSIGPTLTGAGARLSHQQLLAVIHGMGHSPSSMPALPAGTNDKQVSCLVAFLETLR